jgi:phosphoglycolate phosphatase-like HAD superfamily hydrolase
VTSGTAERVRREISRLGLAFDAVVCTEEVGRRKPDPAALHLGLERLGVAPREAAYVGDSPEDIEMARAAGVYAVAIPGAFPNREQLRAAGPDLFSEDLLNAVRALLGAGRSA